jgi:hypothetical protein
MIEPKIVPTVIDSRNRLRIAEGAASEQILENVSRYSDLINRQNELRQRYLARCLQEGRRFLLGIYYRLAEGRFLEAARYTRAHLSTRMQRNWMRGLITLGTR